MTTQAESGAEGDAQAQAFAVWAVAARVDASAIARGQWDAGSYPLALLRDAHAAGWIQGRNHQETPATGN